MAEEPSYYLNNFADEILPVNAPTLDAWAAWLSKPDEDWDRAEPTADGTPFLATVYVEHDDIVATRGPDGWSLSREPDGLDFAACRWGPGLGWDVDNILDAATGDAMRDWLRANDRHCDDVEYFAVATSEADVPLMYRAGPPASLTRESVQ